MVLGGLISENVTRQKDKVPFLGDIPWLGTLFQSQQNISQKNNLMIFVTPTIIDPAGNRYHTDDEMPFAQGAVPPQQPLANRITSQELRLCRVPALNMTRLLIVDGHAFAYRAFHAIRELRSPCGKPTNAIYGFIKMLARMKSDGSADALIVVWDGGFE